MKTNPVQISRSKLQIHLKYGQNNCFSVIQVIPHRYYISKIYSTFIRIRTDCFSLILWKRFLNLSMLTTILIIRWLETEKNCCTSKVAIVARLCSKCKLRLCMVKKNESNKLNILTFSILKLLLFFASSSRTCEKPKTKSVLFKINSSPLNLSEK